jgi:putative nucleotidyltransferase with HDIG domain
MKIEAIISKIRKLTPIPQVAVRVMAMTRNPDCSLSDISKLVAYDAAVTANVLRTVNSAAYGLKRKVESIHEAVRILGMKQLVQIVFMSVAGNNLKRAYPGYDLEAGALWKHSATSAFLAGKIGEAIKGTDVNLVFTAALLKDIGKVLLNQHVHDAAREIRNLVFQEGNTFLEAEKKIIGIDHAELGGIIAKQWNFSDRMVSLIQNHHLSGRDALTDKDACIIYLADTICFMIGVGTGTDGLAYRFVEPALKQLGYSTSDFETLIFKFASEKTKIDQLINSF